jgi:hypothetical protein
MPDNIPTPAFTMPPPSPGTIYIPDSGMPKADELQRVDPSLLGGTGADYAKSISSGESITDLIKDVQDIQARGMSLLNNNNLTGVPNSPSPGGFDPNKAFQDLSRTLNPETPSLQAAAAPMVIGKASDYDRYKESKNFQTFGYTPQMGSGQEYKYGNAMTWGETFGKALAGGSHLAWDTFVEGWKGWGRMTEALFTWDSSKLMGSPEEREEMARSQTALMNKYAIYDTAESKDSIWNRQMFGNMLQQSGFAVGAIAQFAVEEFITAGLATALQPALKGVMIGRLAKGAEELATIRRTAGIAERTTLLGRAAEGIKNAFKPKLITTASDLINTNREIANVITKSERVTNAIADGLKALTPGYKTVEEMIKLNKAGAGFAQLAYTGLGGIKRGLSEFNMARSESIFEAASTYMQLKDRLVDDFVNQNGREPDENEIEKIKQNAENASHDNFWTNMGVLSVMNRIQFDNMFKQFSKTRTLLGPEMASLEGKAFQVTGEVAGKTEARVYKKGLLGRLGAVPEIAKTFGKKTAAWEATKSIGKGLMKFEGSEGMQELIQNASDKGLEDYYADLYHGKKGYTGKLDAVVSSIQNPFTDPEGMKTFLMGAVTGRLVAPITYTATKISEGVKDKRNLKKAQVAYKQLLENQVKIFTEKTGKAPEGEELIKIEKFAKTSTEYKTLKQHVDESVQALNALYQDKTWVKNEAIANIKINNKAADTMDVAAANHDKYIFNNTKDSVLAKAVASAIKLNLYDSMRDVIKEYGAEMSDEEFGQAFGMNPSKENKGNAKKLTENIVKNIEDYYDTFKKLKDKYADRIIPDLYKNNKPEDYKNAQTQKAVLDDVIEMLATNNYKAKQTIVRAVGLQTEIGQNKAIGSSSIEVITKLGSDQSLALHEIMLRNQIKNLEASEVPLTPEQKEQYKDLKEELQYVIDWSETKDELLNEIKVDKSYRAFAGLVNLFNKRAKNYTTVSKEDIEDNFLKFIDYIKLNKDNKKFIDAMNLLSDPKNMKLVNEALMGAAYEHATKAREELLREIEKATGVDIARYTVVKDEDGTFSIVGYDGAVVESKIPTEEEANTKAAEYEEKFKKALEEEEAGEDSDEVKAKKEEIEKVQDEILKLANLRANDAVVAKAIKDSNAGVITIEELDAVFKKWNDENGLTEAETKLNKLKEELAALEGTTSTDAKADIETKKADIEKRASEQTITQEQINDLTNYGSSNGSILEQAERLIANYNRIFDVNAKVVGYENKKLTININGFEAEIDVDAIALAGGATKVLSIDKESISQLLQAKYNAELDALLSSGKITADELMAKIKNAKSQVELDKAIELAHDDFTDEELDKLEDAVIAKREELAEIAARIAGAKTVTDTDPEFVKLYYEALDNIDKVVNKPGATWAEAKTAFNTLRPILNKLEPAIKAEYAKKYNEIRSAVEKRFIDEKNAKDIEAVKNSITESLSSDDVPLNVSFENLYNQLNLNLSPDLKQEAIDHFEKEYLKAIDRKINKLLLNINTTEGNEALAFLIAQTTDFRDKIEKSIQELKDKSQKLKEETDKLKDKNGGLNVEVDNNFTNPVHRGIISRNDGPRSYGQGIAIQNLIGSGTLTQSDIDSEDENSKHGASELINLGVARILTLEINKALAQHFRGESNSLKELLVQYLTDNSLGQQYTDQDGNDYVYTKAMIDEEVKEYIDKNIYATAEDILTTLNIPKTRELTKEESVLLKSYRKSIFSIIKNTNVVDTIDSFKTHYENLNVKGETVLAQEIIPFEFINDYLKQYFKKGAKFNNEEVYADVLDVFEKLKTITDKSESIKLIKNLNTKYFEIGGDGLEVLKSLYSGALQTDNILRSSSDGSTPLTTEEIVKVLNDEDIGISLNKEQINQIDKYAKEEKLPEYKKKLSAAVGYSNTTPIFVPEKNIVVTSISIAFNSLRPKFANDQRTAEDLSKYLMPDENGMVQTKLALTFISVSSYATDFEKALAKKLLEIVSDEDMIKIDNNIKDAGEFDPNTNQIAINLLATGYDRTRPSSAIETVILHELIHAMTEEALADTNSQFYKSIKGVFNAVKNVEGANTFYAFQDTLEPDEQLREFVTEAFTNPAFQYLLSKTPYANTQQSIWDKFIEIINSILGALGIDVNNTALSETLSLTNKLLNKEAISEGDKFPSEKVMEKIKNANTKEDIEDIRKDLESTKDKYAVDTYNALDAALKGKLKSIIARELSDTLKDMEPIKIGKVTYYISGDSKSFKVFKKGRTKINEVKDAAILAKVKEILDKRNPPPPPGPGPTGSSGTVQIFSDLKTKEYEEDPSVLDFSNVYPGKTITAVEPNGLRSKGNDIETKGYTEQSGFVKYYFKIRSIINKLSTFSSNELDGLHVTLDKDDAGFRWDGSSEDEDWKKADKGVIGYISDKDGNPIVFDKNGKKVGIADRKNPASSPLNSGENQIVYFNTYTEKSDPDSLSRIEKDSLAKIFAARRAVMEGRPQIAKVQRVTMGQMVLQAMVKPKSKSQKNTARDSEINQQFRQEHVMLALVGSGQLNVFIQDNDGGINRQAVFTPTTSAIKVAGPDGNSMGLFDYFIELLKTYQEMVINKDPNAQVVYNDLVMFAQNMWFSSTARKTALSMPKTLKSITIRPDAKTEATLSLFDIKNGMVTINEDNVKRIKDVMNNLKLNVAKIWLEGREQFKFPYITEENGKKTINFEDKNYKDFLLDDVGLITYINDIPAKDDIKRYNSSVHFLEPTDLISAPPTITVTQQNIINNSNSSKQAVDNAVNNATPATGVIKDPTKKRRFSAPSYEQTYKETYEKICK